MTIWTNSKNEVWIPFHEDNEGMQGNKWERPRRSRNMPTWYQSVNAQADDRCHQRVRKGGHLFPCIPSLSSWNGIQTSFFEFVQIVIPFRIIPGCKEIIERGRGDLEICLAVSILEIRAYKSVMQSCMNFYPSGITFPMHPRIFTMDPSIIGQG